MPQSAHTSFSRRRLHPKAAIAATLSPPPLGEQANILRSFLQEKEKRPSSLFPRASCAPLFLCCSTASPACAAHDPTAAGPSRRLLRPSHKQKMRARSIAPRTRSKKRRLLAQENTRRHARLSRSCFGRVVFQHRRPAFTTALFPFSKEKKKENRSKFSRFEYIARTHFVRPHDVCDWPPRLVRCNLCSNCDPFRTRLRRRPRPAGGLDGTNTKV